MSTSTTIQRVQSVPRTCPTVDINPAYAQRIEDRVIATRILPGHWAVKLGPLAAGGWIVYTVPRRENAQAPFLIATASERMHALMVGIRWSDSARSLSGYPDRIVFAGQGPVRDESKPGFDPAELLAVTR